MVLDKIKRAKYLYNIGGGKNLVISAVNAFRKRIKSFSFNALYKKKYPTNTIFIIGFPKSGSSWVMNMFGTIPGFEKFTPAKWGNKILNKWEPVNNLYPGVFDEFVNYLAVVKGHTYPTKENIEILKNKNVSYIVTIRDPRDQLISAYWYIRSRPHHRDYKKVKSLSLNEYITYKLNSGEHEKEDLNWLRGWVKNITNNGIIVRYEDIVENTQVEFNTMLSHLGFNLPLSEINNIIQKNSFESVSGRKRGQENTNKFVRKGVYGEWKETFSDEQKNTYSRIGEDIINKLNYQPTI